jgi:diguanylate cyclase (GGDEF)-like protein
LPLTDLLYLGLRVALGGITVGVAAICLRYVLRSKRNGQTWTLLAVGCFLLSAAAVLSAYDAVDNVVLRSNASIPLVNWLWYFLFDLVMPIWALLAVWAREDRDRAYAELSKLSVTDQLTGALNRRGFFDRAVTSIAQSRRLGGSPAVIMLDIDHFKAINDSYGHGAGDEVLRSLAKVLQATIRPGDSLGRLGGEEFAVFVHDGSEGTATSTAERLRSVVRTRVPHPAGSANRVTVSVGVAAMPNSFEPETALSLTITAADEALYSAKHEGRDRIVTAIVRPKADLPDIVAC